MGACRAWCIDSASAIVARMVQPAVDDAIDLTRIRRALVIKLRHHGDVLLTSPVFSALKQRSRFVALRAELRLWQVLRERGYDLVIHLTDHPRGAWLARLVGARYAVAIERDDAGVWWRS